MSFKSFPFGFSLFVFGILALNAYSDMASAQAVCQPGQQGFNYTQVLTCVICDARCKALCLLQPYTTFCNRGTGLFVDQCLCCCRTATPVPVPSPPPPPRVPSPPPPSPPPPSPPPPSPPPPPVPSPPPPSPSTQAACQPGQQGFNFTRVLTCVGCDARCKALCLLQPYTTFCNRGTGLFVDQCLCCCRTATPVPVPSPPPPPPRVPSPPPPITPPPPPSLPPPSSPPPPVPSPPPPVPSPPPPSPPPPTPSPPPPSSPPPSVPSPPPPRSNK
ncbi:hypothetical protein MKX03_035000 [Papaver bracteatum]|nr:hypothetical protein MKX03_035000 [Papaver bracteatum]